jgi:two-component system NarL family sensor kinase
MQSEIYNIISFCIAITIFIIGLVAFILIFITSLKKRQQTFQKTLNNLKEGFENRLIGYQIQTEERIFHKISQEIHDNVNHTLTLAKLELTSANPEEMGENGVKVKSSINFLTDAIGELRSLSHVLNKDFIKQIGLVKSIEKELQKIKQVREFKISYILGDIPPFPDPEAEVVLFRVFKELIQNIIKHAEAKEVYFELSSDAGLVKMKVQDSGKGFDMESVKHNEGFGLKSIVYRIKELNGEVSIDSQPGKGTNVSLFIPVT